VKPCDLPGCDCHLDELDVPTNPALSALKWGAALGFVIGLGLALIVFVLAIVVTR
jgi:hypothetical protein